MEQFLHASVCRLSQQSHVMSVDEAVSDDAGTLRWSAAEHCAACQCEPAVTVTAVSGVREEERSHLFVALQGKAQGVGVGEGGGDDGGGD